MPMQQTEEVRVPTEAGDLPGFLELPEACGGLVLFAHGSGSSRFSRRNRAVAQTLNRGGLGTLLFDLLTPAEHQRDQRTAEYRFDIPLLIRRLVYAIDWAARNPRTASLAIGVFGASTGAAAALGAAALRPREVRAVVSRGGRPDLAADMLEEVRQPTLFIVGGLDQMVLDLNREAASRMPTPPAIEVVPGASHLFEEPGKLELVAALARDFFHAHLRLQPSTMPTPEDLP
ncbi:dienelactone hydrolase family protein [Thiohalocapsa sp.]|uniref:dienelactone hydrolase family protein n=1 Tax=Thiohalocapsa sp. TaxID=2497641 RepID=UPI0025E98B2E|nr:dienelactone hydrolase family protein [Thiohalocapsa sp.]